MSAPATHPDNRSHQHWGNLRNIPRGFELTHGVRVMRVTALAPDLIRFQVLPNSTDAAWSTGAISRTHWNPVATQVQEDGNHVRLLFPGGCFEIECSTGRWRLQNAAEQTLFETAGEGMHWEQEKVRCSLRLAPGEALFGLGETTGQFDRRGLVRDFWNIDVLGHAPAIHPGLKQLYVSIPYALCWKGGICSALFWDNAAPVSYTHLTLPTSP
jgi:alpha-glucosidase